MNNIITEMKKYTRRSQWQENEAEERISELEGRVVEITTMEHNKGKKNEKKRQFQRPL